MNLGLNESEYEMAIRFTEEFYNQNKELAIQETGEKSIGKPVLGRNVERKVLLFCFKMGI